MECGVRGLYGECGIRYGKSALFPKNSIRLEFVLNVKILGTKNSSFEKNLLSFLGLRDFIKYLNGSI